MAETLISVQHLTCGYAQHAIVEDISFSVNEGEVTCLIGPNGVGKQRSSKPCLAC